MENSELKSQKKHMESAQKFAFEIYETYSLVEQNEVINEVKQLILSKREDKINYLTKQVEEIKSSLEVFKS